MDDQVNKESFKINNSQLGEYIVHKDSIVSFKEGIIGYEYLKRFAMIEIEETRPFIWLVSVDEPEISLPVLKYKYIYPDYQINLTTRDLKLLEITKSDKFYIFFIITVNERNEEVTANLKGPLILNTDKRIGIQTIATNEEYVINYPVVQEES